MPSVHISLSAETVFNIAGINIGNSLVTTWLVMIFLVFLAVYSSMRLKTKPDSLQLILELLVGGLHKFFADILGDKINRYFPWLATLFIYILALNWVSVLPGVGSVGIFRTENEKIAGGWIYPNCRVF